MPVYPGDPCARLYQTATIPDQGFSDHKIESGMHVGTHMDAPLHMIEGGMYVCDIPLEHVRGRGVVIDARSSKLIDATFLNNKDIQAGDIVLVWTGWDKKYRAHDYFNDWPIFSEDFAQALVEKKISLIGMDTPGPETDEAFPVHKIFLLNNILIIENLTGLEQLQNFHNFIIHAYPMKYRADAAPVRVVAEIHAASSPHT